MRIVILYTVDSRLECGEYGESLAELSLEEELKAVEDALDKIGYEHRSVAISDSAPILSVANLVNSLSPDCVFNLCESLYGDTRLEMAIPALLDLMKIPYTGSGAAALALCQDKPKTKAVLRANGIKTPREYRGQVKSFPVIVKPSHEDGSLGISEKSVVYNRDDLDVVIAEIWRLYSQPALIEEYIEGREFGIGVIDFNGGPIPFPCSEILFNGYPAGTPKIVSYNAKWNPETIEYKESIPHCPADIDKALSKRLQAIGLKVFKLFECRGYIRVDVRVRGNDVYVIDVNCNPDISPGSGVCTVLNAAGVPYEEFVQNLIEGALRGK